MATKKPVVRRRAPIDDGMIPIAWVPVIVALLCGLSAAANVLFANKG